MDETAKRIQDQVNDVRAVYEEGRRSVSEFAKTASERSKEAFSATDEWIHENPWMALGIVAGVGVLLGVLFAGSFRKDY